MTLQNNREPIQYYTKLCASFQSHRWIQTWVTVLKRPIRVKICIFLSRDLQIWQRTLKNNRAPFLLCFKLCALFHSHQWIKTGVTVQKYPIWVKIDDFFVSCNLEISQMTLKNNRAHFLCYFKFRASFQSHWWIQTGVTVPKCLIWFKIYFLF